MEREQLLKVMVPVGGFAVLLVIVGAVIALNSGGATPSTASTSDGTWKPADEVELGSVPLSADGMTDQLPPLDSPEWKNLSNVAGMKFWDVKEGNEDITALPERKVKVHYTGWLLDGRTFDSSVKRGEPSEFALTGVISGWKFGIPGMKVGSIRRLYIPAEHAYGSTGQKGIPPNATLVFEVKLLRAYHPKK